MSKQSEPNTVGELIPFLERQVMPRHADDVVYFTFEQQAPTILGATYREFIKRLRARNRDEAVSCVTTTRADWPEDAAVKPANYEVPLWIIGGGPSFEDA